MSLRNPVILLFLAFSFNLFAQENQTLLGQGEISHSGYGAVEIKMSSFDNDFAAFTGAKGAWVINKTILLGGGGYGMVTKHMIDYYSSDENIPDEAQVYNGYGGVILGYINNQSKLLHFSTEVLIGAGNIHYAYSYDDWHDDNWNDDYRHNKLEEANYFVIEPSLYLELNVTDFMVVGAGAGYRFVNGVESLSRTYDNDLSRFSGNFVVKFGKF